jgi:hypothetical protein
MMLVYVLLIISRKLSHYFQEHQIDVHTSSTLGEILNNRETTEKITKWATELPMYDIVYKPQMAIKAQTLSDFMAEWTVIQTLPKGKELEYCTIKGESFKYVLQMHFPASNNVADYEALLHSLQIATTQGIHRC